MFTSTNGPTGPMALSAPVKLNETHDLSKFDCGQKSINDFLKKAFVEQENKRSVFYVSCFYGTNIVAAYYTLSSGSVSRDDIIPKKNRRNSPAQHPVTILGRMGVTLEAQGQGYASDMLKDAISRCITASEAVASSSVIVHPLTEDLVGFYARYGFIPSPDLSPLTMMLSLV